MSHINQRRTHTNHTQSSHLGANRGNLYQDLLGTYRDNQPRFYNHHPRIFNEVGDIPDRALKIAGGALVPEKGLLGTLATGADRQGAIRLVVYAHPRTRKPSGWTLLEWRETGRKHEITGWPEYGWNKVSTVEEAINRPGFYKLLDMFVDQQIDNKKP